MIKKCLNCNKEFKVKTNTTTYKSDFCSAECAREHSLKIIESLPKLERDRKEPVCILCSKRFHRNESRTNHILQYHRLSSKEYYDFFFKKEDEGKCLYCGKETSLGNIHKGYAKYCNKEHEMLYLKENFGVTNIAQRPDVLKKIKENNLEKYGVENVFAAKEFADKIRVGGCRSILKDIPYTEFIKDGKVYFEVQREDNTFIEVYSTRQALAQRNARLYRECGMRSQFEYYFAQRLEEIGVEYEYEHKDDLYPYDCDFYLPKYKAYVELHTGPQHGQCFYDKTIHKDENLLEDGWNHTWKVRDVEKRKCAIKNNLNYVVLFTITEINDFLRKLNENK